jgi:hypothetical protein
MLVILMKPRNWNPLLDRRSLSIQQISGGILDAYSIWDIIRKEGMKSIRVKKAI